MSKYPLKYYQYVLGQMVSFLEDKPELVEGFIGYCPKSEEKMIRDLFNQY